MGFIQNIKDWKERKKTKKIIGETIQKTQEAEENPNKEPLNEMLKLAKENPDIVDKFIQEVIANKNISDKNVKKFLEEAPIEVARDAIKGIGNLDDEININKKHVSNVAEGIYKVAKKVERSENADVDYNKMEEALENMMPPNIPEEQKRIIREQREEFESIKIEKTKEQMERIYRSNLSNINETDLYFKIRDLISSKNFKEIPKQIKEKINQIVAKKKAIEFKKTGSLVLREEIKPIDLKPEKLLKNNIPTLIEEEYEKSTIESNYDDKNFLENVYHTPKLKVAIISQIMNKIADGIKNNSEKQVEPIMEYIRENNADLTKEEIDQIENQFISTIKTSYKRDNRRLNEVELRARINGASEKAELLGSIDDKLKGLPKNRLEKINKLIQISGDLNDEEMSKVNEFVKYYAEKKELQKNKEERER